MSMADTVLDFPLSRMSRAVRDGEVTAEALVDASIRRIEAVNPSLNAVVRFARDEARASARRADLARSKNESLGALHGIPMTIKDSLDTAGIVSTGGTLGRKNF